MKNKITFKKSVPYILLVVFVIGCVVLGGYNLKNNNEFLKTPLSTIISMFSAVVLSFYFVQRKTDNRRKKEKVDKLLYKIQDIILEEKFLVVKDGDLIVQRSLANKIQCVKENADESIMKEVEKIEENFDAFQRFYGDHYTDAEYMEKSKKELKNYISLIDDCCDQIHMKLM